MASEIAMAAEKVAKAINDLTDEVRHVRRALVVQSATQMCSTFNARGEHDINLIEAIYEVTRYVDNAFKMPESISKTLWQGTTCPYHWQQYSLKK